MTAKKSFASLFGLLAAFAVAGGSGSPARAYEAYRNSDPSIEDCEDCHGGFRASPYRSLSDDSNWGDDLHDVHRYSMLSGECDVCHSAGGRTPVFLNSSSGGPGLDPISCIGCHGRAGEGGAGLRQHHWNAGVRVCLDCHDDARPSNFTPVGEDILPPYYADAPNAGYPDVPTDPCNPPPDLTEDYAGTTLGLDNDGDLFYDTTDADCALPTTTTTTTTSTTTTSTTTTLPPTTTTLPGPTTTTTTTLPAPTTTTTTTPPATTTTTTTTTPPTTTTSTTLPATGKVLVCHKGRRTLFIRAKKASKHLAHGDSLGACADSDKVLLCHKGRRTIYVAQRAETRHLAHGDTPGTCAQNPPGSSGGDDDDGPGDHEGDGPGSED